MVKCLCLIFLLAVFQRHFTHEASFNFPQIYIFCSHVERVLRVDITDALASDKIKLVLWNNLEL